MADEIIDEEFDDEEVPTVDLETEDGTVIECECVDTLEYEGATYTVFLPVEEDEDGTVEPIILKVEPAADDDEFEQYAFVESEELLGTLFKLFIEKSGDKFDFVEE